MDNRGTNGNVVFGCTDAVASSAESNRHTARFRTRVLWLCMCLIMPLVMAFKPAGTLGSGAPGRDAAISASMYALTTGHAGSQATMGEVYVALDGTQARIYQRGSGSNAVFALGVFPFSIKGDRLEVAVSEQKRREAWGRVARSLDVMAAKIESASPPSLEPASAGRAVMDGRLGNIQLFLDSERAEDMAVSKALATLEGETLQPVLNRIRDLKKACIPAGMPGGVREADRMRTKDSLRASAAELLAYEGILDVFLEKEMLGSLLSDMDAVDREIALCCAEGARIAREGSTGRTQTAALDETAAKLEQLERLSVSAAHLERQYSRFMTVVGFEDAGAMADQGRAACWNTLLWESMTACFAPEDTRQYEIQSGVCRPLERLAAHCAMAGDAARALRTLRDLGDLAPPAGGNTRISLTRAGNAWISTERRITLQPVLDSSLTDWRLWERWAHEIGRRI